MVNSTLYNKVPYLKVVVNIHMMTFWKCKIPNYSFYLVQTFCNAFSESLGLFIFCKEKRKEGTSLGEVTCTCPGESAGFATS